MKTAQPFDLERFVKAQDGVFAAVTAELTAARKTSHWMWFVFPQLRELGRSPTATFYGIASLGEARAYLNHALLGPRLADCTARVLTHPDRPLRAIFGSPDDLKFCSSMTLFARACAEAESLFQTALDRCCAGRPDERTLAILARGVAAQ